MLLNVHVFGVVKLGLKVAMVGLGVVMAKKFIYKLKNKHVMKSYLWN
jgi:hypothetical protein